MVIGMCVLVRTEGARWAMVSRMRVSLASAGARGRTSFNKVRKLLLRTSRAARSMWQYHASAFPGVSRGLLCIPQHDRWHLLNEFH